MLRKIGTVLKVLLFPVFLLAACVLLALFALIWNTQAVGERTQPEPATSVRIMDRFDTIIADVMVESEQAAKNVPKFFWLQDGKVEAPVPNQECYGTTDNPADLAPVLEAAATLLDGQDTLFSTDVVLRPNSKITYYLDESILAITWKEVIDGYVYTISEVKVGHPTQFRRHLAGGEYGAKKLYTARQMSEQVNAVVASSADYYRGRKTGTKVYEGLVRSVSLADHTDVCYIDENGDMLFSYRGQLMTEESVQKFVNENNISFSLSFGPVLVDNGVRCEPKDYAYGEVNGKFPRAALCQMGQLHYLVIMANSERQYFNTPTIHDFARNIAKMGCQKAYALDGGNTGTIVMNNQLINVPSLGYERLLSDIIYFCSAVPNVE